MSELFLKIVNMSISASWVVIAVLTLRFCLKKAPKWVNVLLWGIVAARMVFPFSIESVLSLIPSAETISPTVMMEQTPSVQTGVPALNHVINPVISSSFTPAPGASANPLQIWIPVLTGIWLFGIAALFLYSAVSYWRLHRKVCEAVILRGNIYQSEKVCSPFVLGIIKPKIYLPYHMDSREMDHVIAHEQTHIRRKDHWWKPLGFLLLTIHWFNPLMWLSYILLCRDIELACDEKVIREMGNEQRADYTQALVACSVNRRVIAACPLAFGEVGVKERVKSVMNYKKPAFWIVLASVIVCAAAAVCFLTNPKSEGSNDITELLAPGSAWSYQLGYDADFPVDASFTVQDDLSVVGTIVKNDTNTDFCIRYRVRGTAGWAEFYGCTPEMAQEAGSEKYLLFTASLRADNGKLVFRMSDGNGLSCFGTREATFTQIADTSSAHTEPWFDYLEKPEEMNWDGNLEIELPEYPDVTFRWYPEKMDAVTGNEVMQLYTGMPIWNTYFSDLTGDGLPELCSTLSFGSGMIDSRIIVYDYANGTSYMLEDRGKYDYSLRLNETDGCLWVVKKAYNSDDIVATGKLLFADNCLQVAYDLKTNCESTPNTETSTSETENTLRTSDTVELIGYVGNSQTSWIELYESTDNKEPIATVPYDLIAALPGCDRKSEAFTFGYLDSITFYYGKIGAFCWCVAALPPAAGTGAANVCTSMDNGETWSISIPDALYTGTVIGAGFASEMVGFISYRYFFDNGPEIARTLDGGKTWARLELDIPEEYAQYNMQPQNPTFSGNDGSYPVILLDKDGNDSATTLQTHDGGMTWTWDSIQASDSNTLDLPEEAAAWVNTYLSAQYTVLDCQTTNLDGTDYLLLLTGSKNADENDYSGYQVFALEKIDTGYSLYAWNEAQPWDSSFGLLACAMRTDAFAAVYGFIGNDGTQYDALTTIFEDGTEETTAIMPGAPFLHVFTGRLIKVQDVVFSSSASSVKWSEVSAAGLHAPVEDGYPPNDGIDARVRKKLDFANWLPEYEDGVREFELEDSKRSDLPGDFFQWPRYYSVFGDYFIGMNADLHYLDADAVWTQDLSEDGQTLIVTMTPGNGDHAALTLSYSLQTQEISSGDRLPAIMTLTIFDLNTSPSGEKTYTLSAEDAAILDELFSIDSMTPTASDSESVCAYQFDIENRSYLLDDSLDYVDVVVRESEGDYTYYCKHLSDAEIESLREIIEAYAERSMAG